MTLSAPRAVTPEVFASDMLFDCFVKHTWPKSSSVLAYLPEAWREYVGVDKKGRGRPLSFTPQPAYRHPLGGHDSQSYPPGGEAPGSDPSLVRTQLASLDHQVDRRRSVLCYDSQASLIAALPNQQLAHQMMRALNTWTQETWLSSDPDMGASILVPTESPSEAAREIERIGDNPQMLQVLLCASGLSKPFGHEIYHPIFEAAVSKGLPVAIRAGGDALPDVVTHPTASGPPSMYAEFAVLKAQSVMSHAISLISQGVFEKYPSLKVMLLDCGIGWIPMFLWRSNSVYRAVRRQLPWLTQLPEEYFRSHFGVVAYPKDKTPSGTLSVYLDAVDWLDQVLCFGSGYPDETWVSAHELTLGLDEQQKQSILYRNASGIYA